MVRKQEEEKNLGDGVGWLRGPLIGKGGFGSVYLANSKTPKSRYGFYPSIMAVKSAVYSVSGSIQKEKEVLYNLRDCRCPNVLRCFGEETTTNGSGDMVYNLLLEYASGGTLADLIRKSNGSGLLESEVKRYTRSILKGLYGIHECGYVHCDVKPENILLVPRNNASNSFVAKIGDFGLAKKENQSKKRRLLEPYLRGTAMYLAPEAVADNVQDPPSDIWSLGCVVLEMLTGKAVWEANPESKTKDDLLRRIGYGYELPKIPNEISKEGKEFLKRCFVRKSMFRLTAEMLLDLPFVAGVEDEKEEGQVVEIKEAVDVNAISSYVFVTDDDLSSSVYSDDSSSFTSEEEDCSFGSWSEEDAEEMSFNFNEVAAMGDRKSGRIQFPAPTIPAGVGH